MAEKSRSEPGEFSPFSTVLNVYSKVMVEIRAEPTIEGKPLSIRGYIDRNAELKVT